MTTPAQVLQDLLSLVDADTMLETIASWDDATAEAVERWAAAVHLYASDNHDVEVPPRPEAPGLGDGR